MRPAAIGLEPISDAVIAADVVAAAGEQDAAPRPTAGGRALSLSLNSLESIWRSVRPECAMFSK